MKKKFLILIAVIAVIVLGVLAVNMIMGSDYSAADKRTRDLKNYTMDISTIVTLKDGSGIRQSAIDQTVKVQNKGSNKMTYMVETVSTSTNSASNDSVVEENSYIYKDSKYYYTYPGVKYCGETTEEMALMNIEKISNVIAFSYDQMYGVEKNGGEYTFEVENGDVSDHIAAVISGAVGQYEDSNFTFEGVSVTATVEGGYVTDRSFNVSYGSDKGEEITVEVYTQLKERKAEVESVDESKYVSITG